jgi:hypothetical protein
MMIINHKFWVPKVFILFFGLWVFWGGFKFQHHQLHSSLCIHHDDNGDRMGGMSEFLDGIWNDDVRLWWFFWLMIWWQKISEAARLLKELSSWGLWNCLLHLSKLSCVRIEQPELSVKQNYFLQMLDLVCWKNWEI